MKPQTSPFGSMIVLADHDSFSATFRELYDYGMMLINKAENCFCNDKALSSLNFSKKETELFYIDEVKHLNACMMQVASWLLLERAAREQDIPTEITEREKQKITLDTQTIRQEHPLWQELPENFRDLVEQVLCFIERIHCLNQGSVSSNESRTTNNPVNRQLLRIKKEFDIL